MGHTFVIAEAGVNHEGRLDLALALVDAAADAAADAVKFQTFKTAEMMARSTPKAAYQLETTSSEETYFEMGLRLELSEADHLAIIERCAERGIEFLSTPFDAGSVELLERLGMRVFKVPSGEITNLPLMRQIGALGKPVILSTGMSDLDDIAAALDVLTAAGAPREQITLLHCTTEYPAPLADVNLRAMCAMRDAFGLPVGYSDHTQGITVPIAAVALGATMIEKHLTLDKTMVGPDHAASLEPDEFAEMVAAIRDVELALGDGVKRPAPSEIPNAAIARKSVVAAREIAAGEVFSAENVTAKRPGTGMSPMRWDELIGKPALRAYAADEQIDESELGAR